jgi:hypothetical protein
VKRRPAPFEGTEEELTRLTRDLHDIHHDVGRPALAASTTEWRAQVASATGRVTSRRRFLFGAGSLAAGTVAGALLSTVPGLADPVFAASPDPSNRDGGLGGLRGDLAIAGLAASLENLAVFAYGAALKAAAAGTYGTVPPAVATFATTVRSQHREHAAAWNAILTQAGKHPVTATEPTLTPLVQQKFARVTTVPELATLALLLENIAAQTYQEAVTKVKSRGGIATAASIQPVEMQHAAILYFVLGQYPGIQTSSGQPLAFNPTSLAA